MSKETKEIIEETKEDIKEEEKSSDNFITREEYNDLKEKLESMQRGERPEEEPEDAKYVRVNVYNDKIITGWAKKLNRKKIDGENIEFITLYSDEEKVETEYLDFMRNVDKVKAKVLDERVEIIPEFQGYTTRKFVDGYRTIETKKKVPVKIETLEYEYDVEILAGIHKGKKLTIKADYLN